MNGKICTVRVILFNTENALWIILFLPSSCATFGCSYPCSQTSTGYSLCSSHLSTRGRFSLSSHKINN